MHRTLKRTIAAATLAAPLTLGVTTLASADTFNHHSDSAGPHGASTHQVSSSTNSGGSGGSSYHQGGSQAGPNGASSSSTNAHAGDTGSNGLIGDLVGGLL